MDNHQPVQLTPESSNPSFEDVGFSLKGSYMAYIFPTKIKTYGMLGNAYLTNVKLIDSENQNNYKVQYLKATYAPDVRDLLYKRYEFYGQTSNLWQKFADKLVSLKETIGDELFNKMRFDQQLVMAATFGVINASFINPRSISRERKE